MHDDYIHIDDLKEKYNELLAQLMTNKNGVEIALSSNAVIMSNVKRFYFYNNLDPIYLLTVDIKGEQVVSIPTSYFSLLFNLRDGTPPLHYKGRFVFPKTCNMWNITPLVEECYARDAGICVPVFRYAYALFMDSYRCPVLYSCVVRQLLWKMNFEMGNVYNIMEYVGFDIKIFDTK